MLGQVKGTGRAGKRDWEATLSAEFYWYQSR